MKKFNLTILLLSTVVLIIAISFFMFSRLDEQQVVKDEVYIVIKTTSENINFWGNVINGAEVAATELGVDVKVRGPEREINIEEQIQIMNEIIDKKPQAIAIAAVDYNALADVCEKAIDNDIVVVTYDSDAAMNRIHSFVATNNINASKRIGHELATLIDGDGTVAIVSHVEGASTAFERIEGFKQGVKPFGYVEVIESVYYTDNRWDKAYDSAMAIIESYPDIAAIYATNEVTLHGVGEAIKDSGYEDDILVVGFDMSQKIALLIEEGAIDATMVQKPFNMGYTAVKEALEVLGGKEPEVVDTGAVLIYKENMFLPENQKLIVPNVD